LIEDLIEYNIFFVLFFLAFVRLMSASLMSGLKRKLNGFPPPIITDDDLEVEESKDKKHKSDESNGNGRSTLPIQKNKKPIQPRIYISDEDFEVRKISVGKAYERGTGKQTKSYPECPSARCWCIDCSQNETEWMKTNHDTKEKEKEKEKEEEEEEKNPILKKTKEIWQAKWERKAEQAAYVYARAARTMYQLHKLITTVVYKLKRPNCSFLDGLTRQICLKRLDVLYMQLKDAEQDCLSLHRPNNEFLVNRRKGEGAVFTFKDLKQLLALCKQTPELEGVELLKGSEGMLCWKDGSEIRLRLPRGASGVDNTNLEDVKDEDTKYVILPFAVYAVNSGADHKIPFLQAVFDLLNFQVGYSPDFDWPDFSTLLLPS